MITGAALLVIALVMRGATLNRYVRSRLAISAALFAAYTAASVLIAYGHLPVAAVGQLHTAIPLFLAFGIANALVVLAINPWRADRIPEHFPNIVQDAIVIALFGLAAMLFLPDKVVTTTAVGAVVVGFALQDTLGNLFAGLAIQIEKPFRVGHWVTIGGKDGLVTEITWRATKIRTKARQLRRRAEQRAVARYDYQLLRADARDAARGDGRRRLRCAAERGEERHSRRAARRSVDSRPSSAGSAAGRLRRLRGQLPGAGVGDRFCRRRTGPRPGALARLLRVQPRGSRVPVSGAGQHRIGAAPRDPCPNRRARARSTGSRFSRRSAPRSAASSRRCRGASSTAPARRSRTKAMPARRCSCCTAAKRW